MFELTVSAREIGRPGERWDLQSDIDGKVSLQQFLQSIKFALIDISLKALQEEQVRGFDKEPITYVDGRRDKAIAAVNPLGKIEFVSSQVSGLKVIEDIYRGITDRSKIVTGTYLSGNLVYYDSKIVASNPFELVSWLASSPKLVPGKQIIFMNVVPYARRLERLGVTAQKSRYRTAKSRDKRQRSGPRILAPNGTYFLTYRSASRLYGKNARIKFGFIRGSTLGIQNTPIVSKSGKSLRTSFAPKGFWGKSSGPYLYPAIFLTIPEKGIV